MMLFHSLALSVLLLASRSFAKEQDEHAHLLPTCPSMTTLPKYHETCNVAWQNDPARNVERRGRHSMLRQQAKNAYASIPTQRTIICPLEQTDDNMAFHNNNQQHVIGMDTRWVVENKSSGKVVIGHVKHMDDGSGIVQEYSAMNGKITPPQADPQAILQPGEFKVVNTFEGHVFNVRQLLADGVTTGEILLQHRPGIVEFTNRYGKDLSSDYCNDEEEQDDEDYNDEEYDDYEDDDYDDEFDCHDDDDDEFDYDDNDDEFDYHDDVEQDSSTTTDANASSSLSSLSKSSSSSSASSHPRPTKKKYNRNLHKGMKHCNMVYQGFRNTLSSCPLDVYYAGVVNQDDVQDGPMQCAEKFKFHLGSPDENQGDDYTLPSDWASPLKFESTFVGHTFVARLASNPNVVVDTYTLEPTIIHDCPPRRRSSTVVQAAEMSVVEQQHVMEFHATQSANSSSFQNHTTTTNSDYMTEQTTVTLNIVLPSSNNNNKY